MNEFISSDRCGSICVGASRSWLVFYLDGLGYGLMALVFRTRANNLGRDLIPLKVSLVELITQNTAFGNKQLIGLY